MTRIVNRSGKRGNVDKPWTHDGELRVPVTPEDAWRMLLCVASDARVPAERRTAEHYYPKHDMERRAQWELSETNRFG